MNTCPFCEGPVPETTLMYGGTCPKCFGEIPGEEAATDPGAVVRAKQAASDGRRTLVKTLVPLAIAVPMLGGLALVAIGFVIWNRPPEVEMMVFDDIDEIVYQIDAAPTDEPAAVAVVTKPGSKPQPFKNGVGDTVPATQRVDKNGLPVVEVAGTAGSSGTSGGTSSGSLLDFPEVGVERSGEVLTDPAAIRAGIKKVMDRNGPQLGQCYNRALKTREDLRGRWTASFSVNKDGHPEDVSFQGNEMKDPELEACLAGLVRRWKFPRLATAQPVKKNWKFSN